MDAGSEGTNSNSNHATVTTPKCRKVVSLDEYQGRKKNKNVKGGKPMIVQSRSASSTP